jgi:hypothetical protein
MTSPRYTIEVWPHGWTLSGDLGGIPLTALHESRRLFPKSSLMDPGIAHHLKHVADSRIVVAIGIPKELDRWRAEITTSLSQQPALTRWWHGLDVGRSSAAIFSSFSGLHQSQAREFSGGAVPQDASDFGRCRSLLDLFPEWLANLDCVAIAYPSTPWPSLVDRWQDLTAAHGSADFQPLLDSLIH